MRRRLFNLAALVSLLLCVGVAGLWVRSYWASDQLRYGNLRNGRLPFPAQMLALQRGHIFIQHAPLAAHHDGTIQWRYEVLPAVSSGTYAAFYDQFWNDDEHWTFVGFRIIRVGLGYPVRTFVIPLWLVCLVLLILPGHRLIHRLRHRYPSGKCQLCGYDLRATPERCPECGMVPTNVNETSN